MEASVKGASLVVKKTEKIMNYLENYSNIAETVLFFKIISGFMQNI